MDPPFESMPTSLIGQCLRDCGPKQRGKLLEGYPAEVVITCRILGPVAAGKSLGKVLFGKIVTATPILKVVSMVESGEIPVTREQLLAVVQQDESAMRQYALNPWIVDPTGKSAPPTKKGRKPGDPPKSETNELPEAASKKRERQTRKGSTAAARPPEVDEPTEKVGDEKTRDEMPRLTAEKLKELSQQEEEHQRQAIQRKEPEPAPPPFRGTPAPPLKASEEEREEWRRLRKQEMAEFVENARSQGWEIPDDWDGLKSVAKVAKWIGPPPA